MFPDISEIKQMRETIGLSQSELASRVGIAQSMIPKYESGAQVPSYTTAIRIFQVLFENIWIQGKTVEDVMDRNLITVDRNHSLKKVFQVMQTNKLSKVTVTDNSKPLGHIDVSQYHQLFYEDTLNSISNSVAEEMMLDCLPSVPKDTKVRDVIQLLRSYDTLLIVHEGKLIGTITTKSLMTNYYKIAKWI